MDLGSNPGLEFCSLWRLRTNNPAQTGNGSDSAICPTTSPPARRDLWIPPGAGTSSFRADIGEERLEARSAGKLPDTAAVKRNHDGREQHRSVHAAIHGEGRFVVGRSRHSVGRPRSQQQREPASGHRDHPDFSPSIEHQPPAAGPIDRRIASSRRRATERTSRRFATFGAGQRQEHQSQRQKNGQRSGKIDVHSKGRSPQRIGGDHVRSLVRIRETAHDEVHASEYSARFPAGVDRLRQFAERGWSEGAMILDSWIIAPNASESMPTGIP